MERIQRYYTDKTLFITGATGLVGKVLVEKVLRDLPAIRRIYLLIRPKALASGKLLSARDRFIQEIINTPAFDGLRRRYGDAFMGYVHDKVHIVAGDLTEERLGLPEDLYRRLQHEVDVLINSAAVVSFDAPLDQSLDMNTIGAMRVLEFMKGTRAAMLAHLSTCYVNGTRSGPVPEEPFNPTLTVGHLNGLTQTPYDVDEELRALHARIAELRAKHARNGRPAQNGKVPGERSPLEQVLVAEGMRWARLRGWNDVYTFTKAMGEQMLARYHGEVPVLILRPSIIESAFRSPEPGWLDGFRMLDPLIVAYGRERLPDFPGNPNGILDVIPVDMVVNATLAAIPWAHARGGLQVCQSATGMENPLMLPQFAKLVQAHFRKRPLNSRSNRPLHLPDMTFPSTKTFLRRISLRQALPLRAAAFAARFIPAPAQRKRLLRSLDSKRSALDRLMMYARLYGPYAEVRCQYLTGNMRAVWDALSPEEQHQFNFDVRTLDWAEYIQEVHIGGIRRFLLGLDRGESARKAQEPEPQTLVVVPPTVVSTEEAPLPAEAGVAIAVAPPRTATETMTQRRTPLSLASPVAQDEIARLIVAHWWERLLQRAFLGWLVASYTVYLRFQASGLQHLPATGSVVVVTNHSSHLDTGAILVALRGRIKHLHPLAAKDYFFRNAPLAWFSRIFLNAIPFDRQTHVGESLGLTLSLLQRGHSVIFFPEGSRSTTGVIQPFRRGIGVLAVESGVPVVPAYISGAFRSWPKGRALPRPGHVSIRFGPPIIVQRNPETLSDQVRQVTADIQRAVEALAPQQAPARS